MSNRLVLLASLLQVACVLAGPFQDRLLESIEQRIIARRQDCQSLSPAHKLLEIKCRQQLPAAGDDTASVEWFGKCIAEFYCFGKDDNKKSWKKQPSFEVRHMNSEYFKVAASVAETFFKGKDGNRRWMGVTGLLAWKDKDDCKSMLSITAARYLFITHVLFEESRPQDAEGKAIPGADGRLTPCVNEVQPDKKTKIKTPDYACYPVPYGSATCTSDYDIGLVGPKSGELAANFNDRFAELFSASSEDVFDSKIYAVTLEYAMPQLFAGYPQDFVTAVNQMHEVEKYKMQDLVSALQKLKKYKFDSYTAVYQMIMDDKRVNDGAKMYLKKWSDLINGFDTMQQEYKIDVDQLPGKHKHILDDLNEDVLALTDMDELKGTYIVQNIISLIYTPEAYHSRGSLRYVVGWTQMRDDSIKDNITPLDLWTSMLENFGDVMRVFLRCKDFHEGKNALPAEECLLRMSKYLWRTFLGMKDIFGVMDSDQQTALKDVSPIEEITRFWLFKSKKVGESTITKIEYVKTFFDFFGCKTDGIGIVIHSECMDKIFEVMKPYNQKLAEQVFTLSLAGQTSLKAQVMDPYADIFASQRSKIPADPKKEEDEDGDEEKRSKIPSAPTAACLIPPCGLKRSGIPRPTVHLVSQQLLLQNVNILHNYVETSKEKRSRIALPGNAHRGNNTKESSLPSQNNDKFKSQLKDNRIGVKMI